MTVSTTDVRETKVGDGVTVSWSFAFVTLDPSHIKVKIRDAVTGVITALVYNTDFSVALTGTARPAAGAITLLGAYASTPPDSNDRIEIYRVTPRTQTTPLDPRTGFASANPEAIFDKYILCMQEALDALDNRVLRLADGDGPATLAAIADAVSRAGLLLGFDASGQPETAIESSKVSAAMAPVISAATLALAKTAFGIELNVKDYGAVGTGIADDTVAINAAFDAVRDSFSTTPVTNGSVSLNIIFPPGRYLVTDTIDATGIRGINWGVLARGAIIIAEVAGKPVIDLLNSRWFSFHDLAIFGDSTDVPTYGIQMGRIAATSCGEANFHNVVIQGEFSESCFYNFAGEIVRHYGCSYINASADANAHCINLDAANWEDITSAFVTQTIAQGTAQSFNQQIFYACDFRKMTAGTPISLMGNMNQIEFHRSYAAAYDTQCVETVRSTLIRDLTLDIHCETTGLTRNFRVDTTNPSGNVNIKNLFIRDHSSHASDSLIDTTGNTRNLTIDGLKAEFATPANAIPIFGSSYGAANGILVHGRIDWLTSNTLTLSNCQFDGDIFTNYDTTITHTPGGYRIIRQPLTSGARIQEFKGKLRVTGTQDSATVANGIDIVGTTGGNPSLEAQGTSTDLNLTLTPKGTGGVVAGFANSAAANIKYATELLSAVSGASVTSTSLIPNGAFVLGVVTRVTTGLGVTGGCTGYQVGDGTDPDRWGDKTGTIAGTTTTNADATAAFTGAFTAANNVVITAKTGNFDGTGAIRVTVLYINCTAPTS